MVTIVIDPHKSAELHGEDSVSRIVAVKDCLCEATIAPGISGGPISILIHAKRVTQQHEKDLRDICEYNGLVVTDIYFSNADESLKKENNE